MKLRKLVVLFLAAMMVFGTLSACGYAAYTTTEAPKTDDTTAAPDTTDAPDPTDTTKAPAIDYSMYKVTEPTTIKFWYNGKANDDFYSELVAEFNAQSEYVTVEQICIGTHSQVKDQLSAAHQSQDPTLLPGLALINVPAVPEYYNSGVLGDMTNVLLANGFDSSDILPGLMRQVTIDGAIGSLPWGTTALVYYYNKSILDEHNLPFPETWEEFKTWAKAVYDATGKPALSVEATNRNIMYTLVENFGGNFFEEGSTAKTDLDNENVIARMKEFQELVNAGYVEWSLDGSDLISTKWLNSDVISFAITSANYVGYLESQAELPVENQFDIGLAWAIGDVHRNITCAGTVLVMPEEIPQMQKNAAGEFAAWLMTPEIQKRWAKHAGFFLVHESNINNPEVIEEMCADLPELKHIYPLLSSSYVEKTQSSYFEPVLKEYCIALQEIMVGGADFDSTYAAMVEEVEYILTGN